MSSLEDLLISFFLFSPDSHWPNVEMHKCSFSLVNENKLHSEYINMFKKYKAWSIPLTSKVDKKKDG
mgnify:CR=1 FL=1